jgi:hypothetical protein
LKSNIIILLYCFSNCFTRGLHNSNSRCKHEGHMTRHTAVCSGRCQQEYCMVPARLAGRKCTAATQG